MDGNSTKMKNYNFIKNQPLGEDLFKNKSQEKTAQVISEKIINEPEFKIIGIDGEWGSGKSNLVGLIQKKLSISHKFFIYDVWGHQEDEQRYSILSELTEFITRENIIKSDSNWNERLVILTSKQKNTTTTNIPHLSIGFILSLLLIIYVPTVNTFARGIKNLWFKIPIVLLPIILLFVLFIKFYLKIHKNGKSKNHYGLKRWNKCKRYSQEAAQELFKVYHSQKKAETKIEVISEKEPTVKEFRDWMRLIDNDLKQKIVIVFDNFDRLPKKHIQSIWSSIHIFFAEEKYKNIKVIIPFDREHVQNAFKELNGDKTKFGDDYVNKTFDIVFRITKPIMSNWKDFFEEQWRKAFIEINEDELRLVIQVYEFLSRRITPREIISFINEILTIKLLDDKFKERYIAIFVLKKDEIIKDPLKAITNSKEILGGLFYIYSNDSEYAKQLTAIIYHIEVEQALELIYTKELKESMLKLDIEHFNKICNSNFINSIFYSTMLEIDTFENPVLTLATIDGESNVSSQNIRQTWKLFYDRVLQINSTINQLKINDWQITLIKNVSDNKYLVELLQNYFELINDSNIENYIDLIDDLIIDLTEKRVLEQLVKRNISDINYIKLIEYCDKDFEKYKLSTDYKLLDKYLSELDIDEILELKNTAFLPKEYVFKKYIDVLKNNLNKSIDENVVQKANDVLLKIKEMSSKGAGIKNLLEDSRIHRLYSHFSNSNLPIINDLIAMRITRGSSFDLSYVSQFASVLNVVDEERLEEISNNILNYIEYGDLLLLSEHFNDSPLFQQVILKMFDKTDLEKKANIITLIENYNEIKESLEIEDDLLLKEFNKWTIEKSKLDLKKISIEFIDDCINYSSLNISKAFSEVFNNEFKNLNKEGYENVFDDDTDVHFKYFNHLELENLTQLSLDVFGNKLIEKLKSSNEINIHNWNILSVYESNHSNLSVLNTIKNILDEILNSKIVLNLKTVIILLSYFIKYDLLINQNDVFRLVLKNEFLSSSEFITLLINNSDSIKNIYKNAINSDKEGFRNLINEKREDNPEFDSLAKSLDIRKSKGNSDDN